ncbi:MAG: methyl-accepting chemotaxis protein [Candidatus Pacebacteria bacterium]|nr:methyl-accepting chemotaxis protein [Candidatus Paceibacterota bacterium]
MKTKSGKKMSVVKRVAFLTLATCFTLAIALAGTTLVLLDRAAKKQAYDTIDLDMRIAWDHLKQYGAPRLEGDNLYFGKTLMNDNLEVPDAIASIVGGMATIFKGDTRVTTNVQKADGTRAIGTQLARNNAYEAVFEKKTSFRGIVDILGTRYITGYDPIIAENGEVIGIVFVGTPTKQFFRHIRLIEISLIIITLVITALCATAAIYYANRTITRPIIDLTHTMTAIAAGNRVESIPHIERHDDIGDMAQACEVFRKHSVENVSLRGEQVEKEAKEKHDREMLDLANSLETRVQQIVRQIASSALQLEEASQVLSANAIENEKQCLSAAESGINATNHVTSVAVSVTQLTRSIVEIATQAGQSTNVARTGANESGLAQEKISGLFQAAQKIGEVVSLINSIASQTNLLALNATIESARAGEAGRGFSVVAHEVKNLAGQTARATDDIAQQITHVQNEASLAVNAIRDITRTIDQINNLSTIIAGAVEEQNSATQEIARNMDRASEWVKTAGESIQDLSGAAGETGRRALEMKNVAQLLNSEAISLEREVNNFLGELRRG